MGLARPLSPLRKEPKVAPMTDCDHLIALQRRLRLVNFFLSIGDLDEYPAARAKTLKERDRLIETLRRLREANPSLARAAISIAAQARTGAEACQERLVQG